MIFRIRLPRLVELFGLESDDRNWNDLARPKEKYLADSRCQCWCIRTDTNTTWCVIAEQYGDYSGNF